MSNLGEHSSLTATEIDIIVQKAVRQTFITLGADLSDNKSIQALQRDFAYMRRQRIGGENIAEWTKRAIVVAFVSGLLWAVWQGIRLSLTVKGVAP